MAYEAIGVPPGRPARSRLFWAGASLVAAALVVNLASNFKSGRFGSANLAETEKLYFQVSNEYGASVTGYKWEHIVEPHRVTTLTAFAPEDGGVFLWEIGSSKTIGQTTSFVFTDIGSQTVKLTWRKRNSADTAMTLTTTVVCKYVRRELRTLTQGDRDLFLDSLRSLYDLRTSEGQAKYGSRYRDIHDMVKKHLHGAAARDCDHWHDNAGIVTHHLAFTLELEQSLQAVEPSVSVPYWEYTKDAIIHSDGSWEQSEVFLDSWFGVASPSSTDHIVSEGRWAYTPVLQNATGYSNITNPYGFLRSPWNTNPSPYLTRYHKVLGHSYYTNFPTCSQFAECIKRPSIAQINECLNGETHGPVHIMIGGQWGSVASSDAMLTFGLAPQHLLLAKNLWRHGYVRCPDSCDSDSSCSCGCPSGIMDGTAYEVLSNRTGLLHWIDSSSRAIYFSDTDGRYHVQGYTPEMESDAWQQILDTLCDPGHVGEMYTSAAPYDPTFWVLHTAAERLLQWRRLNVDEYPFDETWGFAHMNAASDVGVVCDWTQVDSGEADLPDCQAKLCDGHGASDDIPFSDFLGRGEKYTNMKFYDFIEPNNDELPYVYDNFEWEHCEEQGVSMDLGSAVAGPGGPM